MRFRRLRTLKFGLKMAWQVLKAMYAVEENRDRLEEVSREMANCEDCEQGIACKEHQQEFNDLVEDLHDS